MARFAFRLPRLLLLDRQHPRLHFLGQIVHRRPLQNLSDGTQGPDDHRYPHQ
jgi:hypothetical protein